MSDRTPELYLEDIKDSIKKIEAYTAGITFEQFEEDGKTIDAVVRNLEIIGEASAQLQNEIKNKNPQVPWGKIVSMRNKVIHGYFGVSLDVVWKTIKERLPELQEMLKEVKI